jgi:hypothetical protein
MFSICSVLSPDEFKILFWIAELEKQKYKNLVGDPPCGSPWPCMPVRGTPRPGIAGHTPSSRNVREAQRLRIARVTFPQRLLYGTPLRGCKFKESNRHLPLKNNSF